MVRTAVEKLRSHPELIERTQYAQSATLDCLIAICKRLGVPEGDIPDAMTPLTDAWLGDITNLVEIDIAHQGKETDDDE